MPTTKKITGELQPAASNSGCPNNRFQQFQFKKSTSQAVADSKTGKSNRDECTEEPAAHGTKMSFGLPVHGVRRRWSPVNSINVDSSSEDETTNGSKTHPEKSAKSPTCKLKMVISETEQEDSDGDSNLSSKSISSCDSRAATSDKKIGEQAKLTLSVAANNVQHKTRVFVNSNSDDDDSTAHKNSTAHRQKPFCSVPSVAGSESGQDGTSVDDSDVSAKRSSLPNLNLKCKISDFESDGNSVDNCLVANDKSSDHTDSEDDVSYGGSQSSPADTIVLSRKQKNSSIEVSVNGELCKRNLNEVDRTAAHCSRDNGAAFARTSSSKRHQLDDDSDDVNADCDMGRTKLSSNKTFKKRAVAFIDSSTEDEDGPNKNISPVATGNVVVADEPGPALEDLSDTSLHDMEAKESNLSVLCHVFPRYDQLELQDVLVRNNWSLKESLKQLRQKESKSADSLRPSKRRRIRVITQINSSDDDSDCTSRWQGKTAAPCTPRKERAQNDSDGHGSAKKKEMKKKSQTKHVTNGVVSEDEAYDSDVGPLYDSDDSDVDERSTPAREAVLSFYNDAGVDELIGVNGCTRKKADIITQLRPFTGWLNLIRHFKNGRLLSTDLINSARDFLKSRKVVNKLMKRCEDIANRMGARVGRLLAGDSNETHLKEQPSNLAPTLKLAPFQLLGINWLVLMHKQRVNGILADEMGLGKTVQTIAFLASRLEEGDPGPHLIVAPASTIDNWEREFRTWCPSFSVIMYQGSLEERRQLRMEIFSGQMEHFDIILATYNMVAGVPEDRKLFRKVKFQYVVFDEAHLLKNMATLRYQYLTKIRAERRLLLTGTPMQNNLVELMSLLVFTMPSMFNGKVEHLKSLFAITSKEATDQRKGNYENDRIEHAKRIMKPFVLRRIKSEVLQQLPKKEESVIRCELTKSQREQYSHLVSSFSKQFREHRENVQTGKRGAGMMMQLRQLANHPLLMRYQYNDTKLRTMAKLMLKEQTHENANEQFVFEDMQVMSDFELNRLCLQYKSLSSYVLDSELILSSGKFNEMSRLLPKMKEKGDRVLLFSQFVIVLDIVESYMKLCKHKYLRLDGSTPIHDRQVMIDNFTKDDSIFLFMLSTKAGGLGINLTVANTVILHDIDFNPYNDKQAEDRCHRLGQTRNVKIIRLIAKDTIEEGMYLAAEQKLKLERDVIRTDTGECQEDAINVASLLKVALGL